MHISRYIDMNKRLVFSTVTGEITLAEVRADLSHLPDNPHYQPDMSGLVDMRNATTKLTVDELREIAESVKKNPALGPTRRALLVGSDLMYGLYRVFQGFTAGGPTEYRVFRDECEARSWLERVDFEGEPAS